MAAIKRLLDEMPAGWEGFDEWRLSHTDAQLGEPKRIGSVAPTGRTYFETLEALRADLVDRVIAQISDDIVDGDVTALVELLRQVPEDKLDAFLPDYQRLASWYGNGWEKWGDRTNPEEK